MERLEQIKRYDFVEEDHSDSGFTEMAIQKEGGRELSMRTDRIIMTKSGFDSFIDSVLGCDEESEDKRGCSLTRQSPVAKGELPSQESEMEEARRIAFYDKLTRGEYSKAARVCGKGGNACSVSYVAHPSQEAEKTQQKGFIVEIDKESFHCRICRLPFNKNAPCAHYIDAEWRGRIRKAQNEIKRVFCKCDRFGEPCLSCKQINPIFEKLLGDEEK
jgi:hypothetical protein